MTRSKPTLPDPNEPLRNGSWQLTVFSLVLIGAATLIWAYAVLAVR
jgi:hypothetical protein